MKELPKILLVDDIEANLILLEKILDRIDAELIPCTRPSIALNFTKDTEFALIILDIQMPEMIGFELAGRIREQRLNKLSPIIFLTGIYSDSDSIFRGYETGAVDYLTIPVRPQILFSKVSVFIKLYNQRKEIEQQRNELDKKNRELYGARQQIIKSLIDGEDRERSRIARELHDGLGQHLTASSLNLNSLKNVVHSLDQKKQKQFHQGLNFLSQAIEESRMISQNLMPKSIEDFGLSTTLEALIQGLQKSAITKFEFYSNLEENELDKQLQMNLYRISQECLNNIIKHAAAGKANLQIIKHKNEIVFTCEDNGKGFDPEKSYKKSQGFGLNSITNRAMSLNGNCEINSIPGKGTSITIDIPIK